MPGFFADEYARAAWCGASWTGPAPGQLNRRVELSAAVAKMPGNSIRMCMAVIGVIPILAVYPFFQKAFIAGISMGGVKE